MKSLILLFMITYLLFSVPETVSAKNKNTASAKNIKIRKVYSNIKKMREKYPDPKWFTGKNSLGKTKGELNFYKSLSESQRKLFAERPNKTKEAVNEKFSKTDVKKISNQPGVLFHLVQTTSLIYSLSAIEILRSDFEKYNIDPNLLAIQDQTTVEKMEKAFEEIFFSGEIYTSMLASSSTHWLFKIPLNLVSSLVNNSKALPIVKNTMIHFTTSLVSFTGWEFGAQLWKEAINMLEFQLEDYEKDEYFYENKNRIFTLAFHALHNEESFSNHLKPELAKKIIVLTLDNIFKVLVLEESRIQWVYNSIRHRIMGGHFVTLVASMSGTSSIASTLFPLASTTIPGAIAIGLTGGLVSMYGFNEEQKSSITYYIKELWRETLDKIGKNKTNALLNNGFMLSSVKEPPRSIHNSEMNYYDVIEERISYREKYTDIFVERIFNSRSHIALNSMELKKIYQVPITSKNIYDIKEKATELINYNIKDRDNVISSLLRIISLYISEASFMDSLKRHDSHSSVRDLLSLESNNNENVAAHFCNLAQALLKVDMITENKDYLLNNDKYQSTSEKDEKTIQQLCLFEVPVVVKSPMDLSSEDLSLFESAIRFIDNVYWSSFDEIDLAISRSEN